MTTTASTTHTDATRKQHLTPEQFERFGEELDAIRQRIIADLGEEDAAYIRGVVKRQRQLEVAFKRYPSMSVFPGALVRLEGTLWPQGLTGLDEDLRVAELEFEEARRLHSVVAYKRFLEQHPEGANARAARALLEGLRFNAAKDVGSAAALRQFLRDHPDGAQREEARLRAEQAAKPPSR